MNNNIPTTKELYSKTGILDHNKFHRLANHIAAILGDEWTVMSRENTPYVYLRHDEGKALSLYLPKMLENPDEYKGEKKIMVQCVWDYFPQSFQTLFVAKPELDRKIAIPCGKPLNKAIDLIQGMLEHYNPAFEDALAALEQKRKKEQKTLESAQRLAVILGKETVAAPKFTHKLTPVPGVNATVTAEVSPTGKVNITLENLSIYATQNLLFILNNPGIYQA